MLVNVMPEGWSLASQLSIIIQLANIGPLIVTLMDLYCRQRLNLKALVSFFLIFLQNNSDHPSKIFYKLLSSKVVFKIYSILLLGFASTLLLHFFWDYTVSEKSIPFFILFFLTSLVDCTSSGNDLYNFSEPNSSFIIWNIKFILNSNRFLVSFIPFMGRLKTTFLQSYFLGEGLSGFLPALVGLIQGKNLFEW